MDRRVFSTAWLAVFPVVYLVGLVVRLLSFQPLWHAVLLPFLPAGPAPA